MSLTYYRHRNCRDLDTIADFYRFFYARTSPCISGSAFGTMLEYVFFLDASSNSFPENLAGKNYSRLPFVWNPSVLRIRNDLFQIRIQLRIFWVPDPTHIIEAYSEIIFKNLKFNQKEKSTNYLPFSISYYCTVLQNTQSRIHRTKIINLFLSALLFFAASGSGKKCRIREKVPDPCTSGFATLNSAVWLDSPEESDDANFFVDFGHPLLCVPR